MKGMRIQSSSSQSLVRHPVYVSLVNGKCFSSVTKRCDKDEPLVASSSFRSPHDFATRCRETQKNTEENHTGVKRSKSLNKAEALECSLCWWHEFTASLGQTVCTYKRS